MPQTCHTCGTGDRVCYPPPGSQLRPVHGGAKSESVGWSDLKPHLGTPLPGTGAIKYFLGNRTSKFGPPGEGGGPSPVPKTTIHWLWWCISSKPAMTSTTHSGQFTLLRCLSRNVGPFLVVLHLYASTEILPEAWHVW